MTNKMKKSQVRHCKGGDVGTNNLSLSYCGFRVLTHLTGYTREPTIYTDTQVFWRVNDK